MEAKSKREGKGNINVFSLQYANLARKKPQHNTSLEARFFKCNCKYQMQSPDCSVNHLQPLTIREQAEQEANSKRLLCSQIQMLPCQCSSHISLLSPSLSLLSPRAAPAVILQKTICFHPCFSLPMAQLLTGMVLSNCPAKYPSIHITKLLSDLLCGFAFAFPINSGVLF